MRDALFTRAVILTACLVAGAVVVARADRQDEAVQLRAPFERFPMQFGEWKGVRQPPFDDQIVKLLGVDDYLTRAYFDPARAGVGLYIGYWASQRQGDTMHSPLNCLPGAGWEPVARNTVAIDVSGYGGGSQIVVNRYLVQKGLDRQVILYWYQSHGRVIASEYWSKVFLVTDAVRLNRTDASIVRVIAPIADGSSEAATRAERDATRFIQQMFPSLDGFLPG
jgi:EpsI family protein